MKGNKHLKISTILLCMMLVFALFSTACTNNGNQTTTKTTTTKKASDNTTATTESTTTELTVPALDDYEDVMVITAYFAPNSNLGNEHLQHQYLLDTFKIDIQAEYPSGETAQAKMSMMVASKEMPDVVTSSTGDRALLQEFVNMDMALAVDEYMAYLGDYRKYATDDTLDFYRNASDEKLYFLPGFCKSPETADDLLGDPTCFAVRSDCMEIAGVDKLPANIDEFYDMLIKMKDIVPQKGGVYDGFVPFSMHGYESIERYFQNAFGLPGTVYTPDDSSQMLIIRQLHSSFLPTMKYLSKLYREGLLDSEILAYQTSADITNRALQGKFGVFFAHVSVYNNGVLASLNELGIDGEYINIEFPSGPDGATVPWLYYTQIGSTLAVINKDVTDPTRLIQYINWQNTYEGNIVTWFGAPDKELGYWYYDDNGDMMYNVEFFDALLAGEKNDQQCAPWTYIIAFPGVNQACDVQTVLPNSTGRSEFQQACRDLAYKCKFNDIGIDKFNAQEKGEVYKAKWTDIDAIIRKYRGILLTETANDADVEAKYSEMVSELMAAGIEDVQKEHYQIYKSVN